MSVPHAILVGGMKCGTTSFNGYIRQHPEIASVKRTRDVHFFSSDENWSKGWDWYFNHWTYDPGQHRLRYESTTQYAKYPQHADVAPRMAQFDGELKLLYLLRNPLDRIESHLAHNVARGHATIEDYRKTIPRAIDFSRYAMQIEKFQQHLPSAELMLLDFNELKDDPRGLLRKVEAFLGVSPFEYEIVKPRNTRKNVAGSDRVKLTDEDRSEIIPRLVDDIRRLRDEYGFDVSAWNIDLGAKPRPSATARVPELVVADAAAPAVAAPPLDEAPQVAIAQHRGAKPAAVCFTFDDGLRSHAEFAAPALEMFGLRGTFFLIAERVRATADAPPHRLGPRFSTDWDQWRDLLRKGHEIGNHGWSHPRDLTEVDDAQLHAEIDDSHAHIAEHLGCPPFSFAYPRQKADDRVREAVFARHGAAREDFKAYNHASAAFSLEKLNGWIDAAIKKQRWFTPVLHVVTGARNGAGDPVDQILLAHFEHVQRRADKLWIDTFGRIYRYGRMRDTARLATTPHKDALEIEVTCTAQFPGYHEPLTLEITAPGQTARARYADSGEPLPLRKQNARDTHAAAQSNAQNSVAHFLLDVPPNSGAVCMSWS